MEDDAKVSEAINEAASSLIADLQDLTSSSTLYVAGAGYDFEEFAVPFAEYFSNNISGVACLWTHECDFGLDDDEPFFTLPQSYVEPAVVSDSTVAFCQSLISDAEEVSVALRAVLKKVSPNQILIVADRIADRAADKLRAGIAEHPAMVLCRRTATFGEDFRRVKRESLASLDDRVVKPGPLMSDWLIDRITRPRLDFTPTPVPPRHPPAGQANVVERVEPTAVESGLTLSIAQDGYSNDGYTQDHVAEPLQQQRLTK